MVDDTFVNEFLSYIPASARDRSGSLLYSGRNAWRGTRPVYVMGFNPGGDPDEIGGTVADQARGALLGAPNASVLRDEPWTVGRRRFAPGRAPVQRSILHVLSALGLDPGTVPTSNLIFVRSRDKAKMSPVERRSLAEECWPFHAAMIERLGVRLVLAYDSEAAAFVRWKVGANTEIDRFVETHERRHLTSRAYTGGSVTVVQAVHPSRSYWWTPNSDISPLVVRALAAATGEPASTT